MHFCVSTTRGGFHCGFCCPRKIGTNWFMPAFVNNRLGESGKSEPDGTIVCCFSRKKSKNDWRISAEVMATSTADAAVTQWLITGRGHFADTPLGGEGFAERSRVVEKGPLVFRIDPLHKENHMTVRLGHDVGRIPFRGRGKFLADRRKRVSRMTRGQSPAVANETGTINAHGVLADRLVSAATFLRGVNIAAGLPVANSSAKTFGAVVPAPFVGYAGILSAREPAVAQRIPVPALAIGRMHFDAGRIFSVPHIFRGRLPAMVDKGLSDLERFRPGEGLCRAGLRAGHQDQQQSDQRSRPRAGREFLKLRRNHDRRIKRDIRRDASTTEPPGRSNGAGPSPRAYFLSSSSFALTA